MTFRCLESQLEQRTYRQERKDRARLRQRTGCWACTWNSRDVWSVWYYGAGENDIRTWLRLAFYGLFPAT